MSKEKQIEEIKNVLIKTHKRVRSGQDDYMQDRYAEALYNQGYRKQSEWISVDERLPTWEDGDVLIYTQYGIRLAKRTVSNRWKGDCAIPKLITHWMPLPEAPKGGKAEEEPKKYFTPEDVRKMSQSEVRYNYQAIMDSMKE